MRIKPRHTEQALPPGIFMLYAHSLPPNSVLPEGERLGTHLAEVGGLAGAFARPFGAEAWARASGLLHDIGKASQAYQHYISGVGSRGPDHSSAGAREAIRAYGRWGRLLAFGIAGHHAGLPDGAGDGFGTLVRRLDQALHPIDDYSDWLDHVPDRPPAEELIAALRRLRLNPENGGFSLSFFARMIFSCLVDADGLATEAFYAHAEGREPPARGGVLAPGHLELIRAATDRGAPGSEVDRVRTEILAHALERAAVPPGLFTMTVPTGGGKTLTSLRFAAEHAIRYGLKRVIYVIPYTSIIEQVAAVFRDEVKLDGAVLEHHSSFDWDLEGPLTERDQEREGRAGLAKLRRDAENWDAPIIVTTAVQFWESLFTHRRERARKLHNIANSVIVLDEVQTLPVKLLRPCMAAVDELTRNYGASIVLCTATQPALRQADGALQPPEKGKHRGRPQGFDIDATRELAPEPAALYAQLKRVRVEWGAAPVTDGDLAARFAEAPQMLCIVNSRRHARDLFELIRGQPGARHLTTLMCAKHRRRVLAEARADLAAKRPARIVSTSLIEAGVDISLPEVWRAAAGLDSIAQAAGRVNRHGELGPLGEAFGRAVVFQPADAKVPPMIASFYDATEAVQRRDLDPLSEEGVRAYFQELYFLRGYDALDAAGLGNEVFPILPAIEVRTRELAFPFRSISRAFRLIDEAMDPVLIPYDADAEAAFGALAGAELPPAGVLRKLQQYTVSVPATTRGALLASVAAQAIRPDLYGDRFVRLIAESQYDEAVGLRLDDPTFRSAEDNIFA